MLKGDLFRMSRRRTTHAVRLAFVAMLLVATALAWPWEGLRTSPDAGRHLMFAFVLCELAAAGLFIPAFVAPAIAGEREQGTLDVLAGCPQSDADLVFGRGLSHAVWALSLLFCGAPFAVGAMIVGGAPLQYAAIAMAHTVLLGTFSIAVALLASLTTATASQATSAAYSGVLGTIGGGAVLTYAGLGLATGDMADGWLPGCFVLGCAAAALGGFARLRAAGAVGAVLLLLSGFIGYFVVRSGYHGHRISPLVIDRTLAILCPSGSSIADLFGKPLDPLSRGLTWGSQLVLTALVILAIARRLKKRGLELRVEGTESSPERRPVASRTPAPPVPPAAPTNVHFFDAAASPSSLLHGAMPPPRPVAPPPALPRETADPPPASARRSAIPVWNNPVLWKDIRILKNPVSGCMIGMGIAVCGLLTIPMLMGLSSDRASGESAMTLVADLLFLGLVIAPTCGSVLSKERATGNLAILAATGFPVRSVVAGKLAAVAWHLRAPLVLTLVRVAIVTIRLPREGLSAALILMSSLTCLACVCGAAASLVRNSKAAVICAFVAGIALWGGPPLLEAFGVVEDVPGWLTPWGMLWQSLATGFFRFDQFDPPLLRWLVMQLVIAAGAFAIATSLVSRSARE